MPTKIDKLRQQARLLWPKYDPDLDTQVNGRKQIHKYVEEIFASSKLQADLVALRKKKNLDALIDAEAQKRVKNGVAAPKAPTGDVSLNQAQIFNVIDELYDERPESTVKDKKKPAPAMADTAPTGDYADYYKRIREMAKDKGMKEEDVLLLLKQR